MHVITKLVRRFFTSARIATIRELCLSLAIVAVLVPAVLLIAYSWPQIESRTLIAIMFVGAVFALLFRALERVERWKRDEEWRSSEANDHVFLANAMTKRYSLTPHRLQILRNRGTSSDVVADLEWIGGKLGALVDGSVFIPEVAKVLGPARFGEEIRGIIEIHDAEKRLTELR